MSYQDIRNTREGFVDSGIGDKIIKIESIILGIVVFILALTQMKTGFVTALVAGIVVAFVFPWLTGLIEIFAWFVTILFSLVWAFLAYFIGGAILGDSPVAGALVAIVVFIVSFFVHKVFAGLGYSSIQKHMLDSGDAIVENTANINQTVNNISPAGNTFCHFCGAPLKDGANFCGKCGKAQ